MADAQRHHASRLARCAASLAGLLLILLLAACSSPHRIEIDNALYSGNYGYARVEIQDDMEDDRDDRDYILDRMRVALLTMADGYPHAANTTFEELYDTLRIQGINADRTVASVVVNEGVKIWKGEPFEQALAFTYYGLQQASLGQWGNARAALDNALFYLRDFADDDEEFDKVELAERATDPDADEDYLDAGYIAQPSNYTLGYLLNGIANHQLGRPDESNEMLAFAAGLNPKLKETTELIRGGDYNTVLVVAWGLGPKKTAEGMDGAIAMFRPRTLSDNATLRVRHNEQDLGPFPVVTNVNQMATDHRWNNLEDVRVFKSIAGTAMVYGGLTAAQAGANNDNEALVIAGLVTALSGAMLKATASADTRYCEATAQRYYVVPLKLEPGKTVELTISGKPGSRLVLAGLDPPSGPRAQLRYVRLPTGPAIEQRPWATSGKVCYHTPYAKATIPLTADAAKPLPAGGRDARPPSDEVLADLLVVNAVPNITYGSLIEMYRREKWLLTIQDQYGRVGLHVLEGGRSLVSPLPGTTGFARLFGQIHPAYRGKSE
ncbi:hypothetical protein [Mucisphaera calidilacus]|uniref:Lipoprotein n=1 Tax=Mucisphaera calidilacus TaxID=2527982 RepID=A0A518BTF4_9BACT|nr:hypothetical protein [Mucisphaera calidilacus]QDU70239.1 hypothetical protein Pan265_00610 [Mucisphaera calidilacus]